MKKFFEKMRKVRHMRWSKLTFGEKVMKFILGLIKWAVIAAVAVMVTGVAVAVVAGIGVAFAIASAVAGGLDNASRAYRPGDQYVHIIR